MYSTAWYVIICLACWAKLDPNEIVWVNLFLDHVLSVYIKDVEQTRDDT